VTIHVNTVLMPVAWEQIEATENHFDFSILDHWIDVAPATEDQARDLMVRSLEERLFSNYTPEWVKADTRRFPPAISPERAVTISL
jgi:hypothetical protein